MSYIPLIVAFRGDRVSQPLDRRGRHLAVFFYQAQTWKNRRFHRASWVLPAKLPQHILFSNPTTKVDKHWVYRGCSLLSAERHTERYNRCISVSHYYLDSTSLGNLVKYNPARLLLYGYSTVRTLLK